MATSEEVTCRVCKKTYVPSFDFDFYQEGDDPRVGRCEACVMGEAFGPPTSEAHPLPSGYSKAICRQGKGDATCKFLGTLPDGLCCLKGSSFEHHIRERQGSMGAQGDNCSGPPNFTVPKKS